MNLETTAPLRDNSLVMLSGRASSLISPTLFGRQVRQLSYNTQMGHDLILGVAEVTGSTAYEKEI